MITGAYNNDYGALRTDYKTSDLFHRGMEFIESVTIMFDNIVQRKLLKRTGSKNEGGKSTL